MSNLLTSLVFSGYPSPPPIVRVELRQADGNHTIALVDCQIGNQSALAIPEDTPAYLDWGAPPDNVDRFYGYVHHSRTVLDAGSGTKTLRYVLIGTSEPLNDPNTQSWSSTTASAIIRQRLTEHKFRSVITPHDRILPYYAQTGISDFQLFTNLAAQTGFRFWVDGATGYFVDPTVLLKGPRANSVPTFSQNQFPGMKNTLLKFDILTGTKVPRGDKTVSSSVIYGLDKRSGTLIQATSNNQGAATSVLSESVTDYADAQAITDASTLGNRNWITAKAVVVGTAICAPGRLAAFNGASLPTNNNGVWFIDGAIHIIDKTTNVATNGFTTTLSLARDQIYGVTARTTADLTQNGEVIPATLRNGLWQASLLAQINIG